MPGGDGGAAQLGRTGLDGSRQLGQTGPTCSPITLSPQDSASPNQCSAPVEQICFIR